MKKCTNEIEIVIVEDNKYDAELILLAFEQFHLVNKSIVLKDGAEALEYLFGEEGCVSKSFSEYPRLILLDLKLPKVNGIEVLRRIKSDERMRRLPVVVLTSSNEAQDVKMAYELGVNSYVTKPIQFQELAKVVANLGLYWLLINKPPRE